MSKKQDKYVDETNKVIRLAYTYMILNTFEFEFYLIFEYEEH
jgi:hypothetical protein